MDELTNNIENQLDTLLSRFVTGSNLIRVIDLVESKDLQVSFKWGKGLLRAPCQGDIFHELIPQYDHTQNEQVNRKVKKLVLADPGIGKSTISYLVFNSTFKDFKVGKHNMCPVFIDLVEYKEDKLFGTEDWLKNHLNKLAGRANTHWVKTIGQYDSFQATPFIILDSLDEYLANCTLAEIQKELNKYIFKEANVIGCRTQFYEYYISSSNKLFVKNYETLLLQEWSHYYEMAYARWYFKKYFNKEDHVIETFLEEKLNSPDLLELCKVPLRYNMILEILAKNEMNFNLVKSRISIYYNFSIMTIRHESSRIGSTLDVNDKMFFLKILAWSFYDERKIGDDLAKIRFSVDNMKEVLSLHVDINRKLDIDLIVNDLVKCSVLLEDSNDEFAPYYSCVKFSHKSIQEFFVSKYIYEEITSKKATGDLSSIYRSFISQEIDIFLKDYFENLNRDIFLNDLAAKNLIQAFNDNKTLSEDEDEIIRRKRVARNQIGYILGHLKNKVSNKFLDEILMQETDEYIRRSITIGLSIGGNKNSLDEYVDLLRKDPLSKSNIINIGFQLSYFGDQPFDVLQPYIDQGLPKCANTVKKLIQALRTNSNQGAWRIDLYSLLYLQHNRHISKDEFWIAIKEHIEQFKIVLRVLVAHPVYRNWQETHEALKLLQTLNEKL